MAKDNKTILKVVCFNINFSTLLTTCCQAMNINVCSNPTNNSEVNTISKKNGADLNISKNVRHSSFNLLIIPLPLLVIHFCIYSTSFN